MPMLMSADNPVSRCQSCHPSCKKFDAGLIDVAGVVLLAPQLIIVGKTGVL